MRRSFIFYLPPLVSKQIPAILSLLLFVRDNSPADRNKIIPCTLVPHHCTGLLLLLPSSCTVGAFHVGQFLLLFDFLTAWR
ncbi:hypothetical protein CPB84DRAFT_1784394 [Gymnopilus junonius]|uniref:Uncharacterized protein n=1 Tax=Gymnopilus junonius TaxID=109634 RepID=A0A9P5NH33_GYMJU|nr:hypothetical protein CPB84DRAFT_1784394 [Gymnopilus junonius]